MATLTFDTPPIFLVLNISVSERFLGDDAGAMDVFLKSCVLKPFIASCVRA
jgi:hypothetical protein